MKISDALQLFGLESNPTAEEVKSAWKEMISKFHPDRNPAGTHMAQTINAANDKLVEALKAGWDLKASDSANNEYADELADAINAVINLEGIEIEVCGMWVWVTGETKQHKDVLGKKGAGYKFAPKKVAWYFRPADYKSRGRGKFDLDQIRDMHGSQKINKPNRARIAA